MVRAFGPHGRDRISATTLETGKILAGIATIYSFALIGHITDELVFYRENHWDFACDNGKSYIAQQIITEWFPNWSIGFAKLVGEGSQLLCLFSFIGYVMVSLYL